jgi:hypothetical protein
MAIDDAEIVEYESSQPINPETGTIDKPTKVGVSDTSEIQQKFWEDFNAQAVNNTAFYKEFSIRKANPQHWYDLSIGSSEYHICLTASRQKHELTAGIYVSANKSFFHQLKAHSEELEKEIGGEIEWREASKACRFVICKPFDMDDKSQWPDALQWLYNTSIAIKKAMKKYA